MAMPHRVSEANTRKEKNVFTFLTSNNIFKKAGALVGILREEITLRSKGFLKSIFNRSAENKKSIRAKLIAQSEDRPFFAVLHESVSKVIAYGDWKEAHAENDFSKFEKSLQKIVGIVRRLGAFKKAARGDEIRSAYEARLDRLTPGLRIADIDAIKSELLPYAAAMIGRMAGPDIGSKGYIRMADEKQIAIIKDILKDFGLDEKNMTLHAGDVHPLAFFFDRKVHLTFRLNPDDLVQNVLDVLHETGHGLYRLHMPGKVRRSFMGQLDTMYNGIDEASALFFEHYVCRSDGFAEYLANKINAHAPELGVTAGDIAKKVQENVDSLNRSNAHPRKYPLFTLAYYDLERQMIDEGVPVSAAPAMWETAMQKYFGASMQGRDVSQSVLQDPHWSSGEMGRFPAGYLIGSLTAAQLYEHMNRSDPQALAGIRNGDFSRVIDYCKTHIYNQEYRQDFRTFVHTATGNHFSIQPFLRVQGIDHRQISVAPKIASATP
jgi:carboxypeptidase Taq